MIHSQNTHDAIIERTTQQYKDEISLRDDFHFIQIISMKSK